MAFNAGLAKSVFGKTINENDLKIVEGIGPVIEGLLNKAGINTWKELSESTFDKLRAIMDAEDEQKFQIHNPATWPDQAGMAYRGEWKELLKWQDELDGGK